MSSDGKSEADALYNVYGIQPTDPEADSVIVEIACHPSMVGRFQRAAGAVPVHIVGTASLDPLHFLTKYASGRVAVGEIPQPYQPNRHQRRSAAARARKSQKARK